MKSSRSAGYTTSGRNSKGPSSARSSSTAKKAPVVKKATSSKESPAKSRFADKMSVPGQAKPVSGASVKSKSKIPAVGRDRFGPTSKPVTGRDRFKPADAGKGGPSPSSTSRPGMNRQESEARIMSQMRRDRLGPGQRS